jgi:hypothetical protein
MFSKDQFVNTIICYQGPINIDLVSFISNYLKQHIHANAVVVSRIYKVLIELLQNVSYYSIDQFNNNRPFGTGIGWFRVDEDDKWFTISTGNRIYKEHGPTLEKNSNEINSLKEEDLRELKRKTRSQANQRDIGAHIGLIQAGLLTGNTLDLSIEPVDDKLSFFTIKAKVNKS